jgi:hypothetical protein
MVQADTASSVSNTRRQASVGLQVRCPVYALAQLGAINRTARALAIAVAARTSASHTSFAELRRGGGIRPMRCERVRGIMEKGTFWLTHFE